MCTFIVQGEESSDGTVVKGVRLPPMWPRFDSQTRRHVWVEFVVGSPPSLKTNISKFQFDREHTVTLETSSHISLVLYG